jgi:hypothetical protein
MWLSLAVRVVADFSSVIKFHTDISVKWTINE